MLQQIKIKSFMSCVDHLLTNEFDKKGGATLAKDEF
jgi:hypothetical protein